LDVVRRFVRRWGSVMRGVVLFAIMFAITGVIDAVYFKGRYLNDTQKAITSLAELSVRIGR
jgi:hypothetical protein